MLAVLWTLLVELAPWLLLGVAVAGLLHGLLPRGFVRRQFAGPWGVLKAALVGVPLPLCSCGVIPAGLGLKKDGASDGAAVAFLISTPQIGIDSILVSASFLGWPFALFKMASAALTGVVGGWLTEAVGGGAARLPPAGAAIAETGGRDWRGMLDHALMILRSIWRWLVVGIVVSAAIELWVPDAWLAGLGALGSWGAAIAALAVSLPLYVCATASVPIAAALVAGGMPAGAALVFLMAGPASNVATIGAVSRAFGGRITAIYLGTLVAGSIGLGVLFDSVLATGGVAVAAAPAGATWWQAASAVVLLALLAAFALGDLRSLVARRRRRPARREPILEIPIAGMRCSGCVRTLESALRQTEGVRSAEVTLEPGRAVVRGTADEARVRETIRAAGYQPV